MRYMDFSVYAHTRQGLHVNIFFEVGVMEDKKKNWNYAVIHVCEKCSEIDILPNHICDLAAMHNKQVAADSYWED